MSNKRNFVLSVAVMLSGYNAWNLATAESGITAMIWCAAVPVGMLYIWARNLRSNPGDYTVLQGLILIQLALAGPAEELAAAKQVSADADHR